MKGHRDLRLIVALTLLCAVLAPLLPVEALSLIFALPLALFLPGYALALAVFARRPIEQPQLLLLGLGLSLSVLAIGALPLNYVPGGIGPVSWTVLLALVTLCACRAAALRRPSTPGPQEVQRFAPLRGGQRVAPRLGTMGVGLSLAALACLAAAIVLTFASASAEHADGYTALWLLPPAPRHAAAGGARVGVNSEEQSRADYRLQVKVGGRPGEIVRDFSLDPGRVRVFRLSAQPAAPGGPVPVRAQLFLRERPGDVYRRVSGWLAEPEPAR